MSYESLMRWCKNSTDCCYKKYKTLRESESSSLKKEWFVIYINDSRSNSTIEHG